VAVKAGNYLSQKKRRPSVLCLKKYLKANIWTGERDEMWIIEYNEEF
jgi:hypothetical protein